jgi:hypothetical protein
MSIDLRKNCKSKWAWISICLVVCANLIAGMSYRYHHVQLAVFSQPVAAYCDNGIRAAKDGAAARTSTPDAARPASVMQAEWTQRLATTSRLNQHPQE